MQETSDGVPISDGFDFPVGPRGADVDVFKTHKIDAVLADPNYFKNQNEVWHPGEDWNGKGGGNTDLGDPIYAVSHGRVAEFGHYPTWGNIVLLEHALPDNARLWSQYAHLDKILVNQAGQKIERGQQIGTMGRGDKDRYTAHLHFELRKNKLPIGNWTPTVKDKAAVLANYYSPTDFIKSHRPGMLAAPTPVVQPQPAPAVQPQPAPAIQPQPQPAPAVQPQSVQVIIVDSQERNPQIGLFRAAQVGWNGAPGGLQREMFWAPASVQQETHWAEWQPHLADVGFWEVWVFIPANYATTSYARYRVIHLDGQIEIPVNQGGNRNQWVHLGTYRFGPGRGHVRLSNLTGEMTQGTPPVVGFDAVCWYRAR